MDVNGTNSTQIVQLAPVTFSLLDYLVLAFFLSISAAVGIYFYCRSEKTTKDYFHANNQLGPIPVGISSGVSFLSTASIMGLPAEVYVNGYSYIFTNISAPLGLMASSCLVGNIVQTLGISSPVDYFYARYKSRILCGIVKVVMVISTIYYGGVCMLGSVIAFTSLTGGQVSIVASLVIGGAVGIFYTSLGGLKAVIWSDVMQASFMLFGVVAVVIKSVVDTPGGMATIIEENRRYGHIHAPDWSLDPTIRHTMWALLIGKFTGWVAFPTQLAYVQRLGALRSKRDCYIGSAIASTIFLCLSLLPLWAGINIFGYYSYEGCDIYRRGWAEKNEILVYYVRDRLQYSGFQGLFLAALLAGSLSSLSSALNASSAIMWEDIIRPNLPFRVNEVRAVVCSKLLVVIMGVVSMLWCYGFHLMGQLIVQVGTSLDGSMYGAYCSLFLISTMIGWINVKGAIAGLVTSFVVMLWLAIGAIFGGNSSSPVMTSTVENCAMNVTDGGFTTTPVMQENVNDKSFLDNLYSISYLYLSFFSWVLNLVVALAVTLCTGRNKVSDPRVLLPWCRRSRCCTGRATDVNEKQDDTKVEETGSLIEMNVQFTS